MCCHFRLFEITASRRRVAGLGGFHFLTAVDLTLSSCNPSTHVPTAPTKRTTHTSPAVYAPEATNTDTQATGSLQPPRSWCSVASGRKGAQDGHARRARGDPRAAEHRDELHLAGYPYPRCQGQWAMVFSRDYGLTESDDDRRDCPRACINRCRAANHHSGSHIRLARTTERVLQKQNQMDVCS